MFLHVIAVDRQLTIHPAPDKPLSLALDEVFAFFGKTRTRDLVATTEDGRVLDAKKTAAQNGLVGDEVVRVGAPAKVKKAAPVEEVRPPTAEVREEPEPEVQHPAVTFKKPRPSRAKPKAPAPAAKPRKRDHAVGIDVSLGSPPTGKRG